MKHKLCSECKNYIYQTPCYTICKKGIMLKDLAIAVEYSYFKQR